MPTSLTQIEKIETGDNAKSAIILCFRDKAFREVERKKTTNEIQA